MRRTAVVTMPLAWQPHFSISPEIDAEHRMLLAVAGECAGFEKSGDTERVVQRLTGLLEHVATHFYDEEVLMRRVGFPGYERHRAEHEAIAGAVFECASRFPHYAPGRHEAAKLARRLVRHLATSDHAIAFFMRQCPTSK